MTLVNGDSVPVGKDGHPITPNKGLIAIQLHAGNPHKTYVKQVLLKVLEDGPVLAFDQATLPSGSKKIDKPKVVSAQGKNPPAKKAPAKK